MSIDLVVAGGGAAGLVAALAAAEQGASVLVLEAGEDAERSNLALSGGLFAGAGTSWQRESGIEDGPEVWLDDIAKATAGDHDETVCDLVTRHAGEAIALLGTLAGQPIRLIDDIIFPGHSVARLHEIGGLEGRDLARLLTRRIKQHKAIQLRYANRIRRLLAEGGRIVGVEVDAGGDVTTIPVGSVVLATGGFGASADLLERHIPAMAGATYIGSPFNDGSGIAMAMALGAPVLHMESYQGHGHVTILGEGRLGAGVTSVGAIMVDRSGRRFVNEDIGPSALAAHVAQLPGRRAVELFTEPMHQAFLRFPSYRAAVERGAVRRYEDADELARAVELDPEALLATIGAYNRAVQGQEPDAFGRNGFGGPIQGALWAVAVTAAMVHTQGGLRIDNETSVLDADGQPIPGLFAAGGCVVGMTGNSPEGYLPGNGLSQALTLGMLAGRSAARHASASIPI